MSPGCNPMCPQVDQLFRDARKNAMVSNRGDEDEDEDE